MKKILSAAVAVLAMVHVYGCDICGCSTSGNTFGMMATMNKNLIGIRTGFDPFQTNHPAVFYGEKPFTSHELFTRTELRARINLSSRNLIYASVPYVFYSRTESGRETRLNGLGDPMLLWLYTLKQKSADKPNQWSYKWQVNTGIKMPFGKTSWQTAGLSNPLLQPGSGSWDGLLGTSLVMQKQKTGLLTELSVKLTTPNKDKYKFGNVYTAITGGFYSLQNTNGSNRKSFIAAIQAESRSLSTNHGKTVDYSSANAVFINPGFDLVFNKCNIYMVYMYPVYQDIAEGYTKVKNRFSLSINYLIN